MREKELRLALVCYGGVSLAVYMHGVTREVWHLVRASRAHAAGDPSATPIERTYARLLETIAEQAGLGVSVLADILAGASAGGLNAIFLGHAIATGRPLDPLTDLWLDAADVDALLDADARPATRFAKMWAAPIAWAAGRDGDDEAEPDEAVRGQVRDKLGRLVRSRWFRPPFGGAAFTATILDALDAIDAGAPGPPLLPADHPLDLFVTVTDFNGHPERLRLHSPAEVSETEHRLTLAFTDRGHGGERVIADVAELAFAARATASFPGAFPPFTVAELDAVLAERGRDWPGRAAFLARALPHQDPETAVLIDGSVLANAPFRPAIDALRNRPARREVDRRFVYVDPHPGGRLVRLARAGETPGYAATILGALSDLPRSQPIRDSLEALEARSDRIAGMRAMIASIRPQVDQAVEDALGSTFPLATATPARLAAWRDRAHERAARAAGYAYASYGHLKLAGIVEELAALIRGLAADPPIGLADIRDALWRAIDRRGLLAPGRMVPGKAREPVAAFFRAHDLRFRIRRLRLLGRRLDEIERTGDLDRGTAQSFREAALAALAPLLACATDDWFDDPARATARAVVDDPDAALDAIAAAWALSDRDAETDAALAPAFAALPRAARRALLFAYLGYPFYDVATLPLLRGEGLDEFDPVTVDRISPDDCHAVPGLDGAPLKGARFHGFGAFFSRAWREHDYLVGRLHGVERLIDILVSTVPEATPLDPITLADIRAEAFAAVIEEERPRLSAALLDRVAAAFVAPTLPLAAETT